MQDNNINIIILEKKTSYIYRFQDLCKVILIEEKTSTFAA